MWSMSLFCSQYVPNTGSSSWQKTQREGADTIPSAVPFHTDKGLQTAVCTNIWQSVSQNLWDTHAACTELEIARAS